MNSETQSTLEGLFSSFDVNNSGYIDKHQLRNLCKGISLTDDEFETIFLELDTDGDERISKQDFLRGFADANELIETNESHSLKPPPQHKSREIKRSPSPRLRRKLMNHSDILEKSKEDGHDDTVRQPSISWPEFIDEMGCDFYLLPMESQEQVKTLYNRLASSASVEMLTQFEEIALTMIRTTKLQSDENDRLEKSYKREKDNHEKHLRQLEEEMEGQVQRVEQRIAEEQQERFEQEKQDLKEHLSSEILQLQDSLNRMQREQVSETAKSETEEMKGQLDELCHSNRTLQSTLTDAQTNLAVMRAELAQLRLHYDEKCRDLEIERETLKEYVQEQEHLTRQLHILHDANKKLHDTNDDLREATEFMRLSPRRSPSREPPLSLALEDSMTNRSQYVAEYVRSSSLHNLHNRSSSSLGDESREHSFSIADEMNQSERRPRLSPLPVQHSVEGPDDGDMHEDVDSGHSTLQGVSEATQHDGSADFLTASPRSRMQGHRSPQRASTPTSFPIPSVSNGCSPAMEREYSFDDISEIMEPTQDGSLQHDGSAEITDEDDIDRLRTNLSRHGSSCSHSSRGSAHSRASSRGSRNSLRRHLNRLPQRMNSAPERIYKVVLCGDAAVGKSSFILRLCKNMFIKNLHSTMGVDFQTKTVEVDGRLIALQLWDTAGQERFRSIAKSYFRRADGVFLVYDCTYERSFTSVRAWMDAIEDGAQRSIPVMLIANKTDLRGAYNTNTGKRCVTFSEGQHLAKSYDALFIETSAKEGSNVVEAATEFARLLKNNEDLEVRTVGLKLHELNKNSSKNKVLPDCC